MHIPGSTEAHSEPYREPGPILLGISEQAMGKSATKPRPTSRPQPPRTGGLSPFNTWISHILMAITTSKE